MHFAWISNDAYAACARKFTFVCQPLDVPLSPCLDGLTPCPRNPAPCGAVCRCVCIGVCVCASVYCYCRSICPTFTTADHDPSAVSLFGQSRITEIRTNNWVTFKCSRMRIPNSSQLARGWSVGQSVRQLVRHSINQVTTDIGRGDCRRGGKLRGLSTNVRHLHFAFCICFAMRRI